MVSAPGGVQPHLPTVALSRGGLICNQIQNKLSTFLTPVLDPQAWTADALSLSWEGLDLYAFPPIPLLGSVVNKILSPDCHQIILIALGWPNMPWFWDLVELSSQIHLCLPQQPDLVVQPFNGSMHRDLVGLNLHAWLLGLRRSNNRVSLTKWQQELRLLKDCRPGLYTKRSGPFLFVGASQTRRTSDHFLSNR